MMALHQLLEAGLDLRPLGVGLKAHDVEGLALGIAHGAALGLAARPSAPGSRAELAEHLERIVSLAVAREEPADGRFPRTLSPQHAHLPGRAVADDRVLLIARDRLVAHAGKEIIGVVVFADMIEAEAP